MATSEDIAQIIDLSNDLLALLQTLIDSGRSSVYVPFIYDAPEVYLVALVSSLTLIHHILAVDEINAVIGNTLFEGEAADGSPLPFATLRAIRVAVVGSDDDPNSGCDHADVNTEVTCLVDAATEFPVLDPAVKQRIITEVDNKVSFNYTGRYSNDVAYPVTINGQDYPWDDPQVPASALYDAVPFVYDRQATAQYTIDLSRNNFLNFPYGSGNQTAGVIGSVGGPFTYSEQLLDHQQGKTGSAIFISEAFDVGGYLPMVSALPGTPDCNRAESNANTGWRICCAPTVIDTLATLSWAFHKGITDYFSTSQGQFLHTLIYDDLANYIRFGETQGTNIGGGTWKPEVETEGKTWLYSLFATNGPMSQLDTGDYIYIDQNINNPDGPGAHGFLIVGWGTTQNCPASLNAQLGTDFSIARQNNGQEIPYIADFCYGYYQGDTGWLQDPRPRPFYCSAATIDISDSGSQVNVADLGVPTLSDYRNRLRGAFLPFLYFFVGGETGGTNWQFFHMPRQVPIAFTRIYIPPCG